MTESFQLQAYRGGEWKDLSPPAPDAETLIKSDFKSSRLEVCLNARFSRLRIVNIASGAVVKEVDLHDWKRAHESSKLIRTLVIGAIVAGIVLVVVAARS